MNWTLGAQRPFEIAPAVFFLENQLRPSIFRGSQRQQFLDAAYLHSIHPKPFLGGPSKYLKIQPNISSLNVKKAWSIPCMNAEYPTPILFCCCRPAYPSFPSARQGWAQPLASVRSIRRSSKIILDHLNASPLWYIIVNSYKCPIRFAAWPWDPASGFGRRTSICLPAAITVLPGEFHLRSRPLPLPSSAELLPPPLFTLFDSHSQTYIIES